MSALRFEPFWSRMDALQAAGLAPPWLDDRQARSRHTRERILEAASHLIASRGWAAVTMQDLAREARISIGALYARFPSRGAVLALLGSVVFDAAAARFERALDSLPQNASLGRVIGRYVETLLEEFAKHRLLIIEVRRQGEGVPELRRLMHEINRRVHDAFYRRARRVPRVRGVARIEGRLAFALFMINAGAREAVLAGALAQYPVPHDARLGAELTRMARRYLEGGAG